MTSSAVTVLPLWNSIPWRILTTHESALPCSASIDSATIISKGPKLGGRTASGSYRFQHRMMSGSATGRWASIVSLAPPPVAPTRRLPPALSVPVAGGLDLAVAAATAAAGAAAGTAAGGEQAAGRQHRAARQGAVQHLAPCQSVACLFV